MFHLITGGSGSGKSAYAESCICHFSGHKRIYIATMFPYDEESHRRIRRHRNMRAQKQFETLEQYTDLAQISVPAGADVLLECMSNLVANELYLPHGAGKETANAVCEGIRNLREQARNLVVVTNEIFSDGIRYDSSTEEYLKILGVINRRMAAMADQVTEVVYGIPVPWKKPDGSCTQKKEEGIHE